MLPRSVCLLVLAVFALAFGAWRPALAQEVVVHSGDTVHVANGGVWELHGARMDFGGVDVTAGLKETSGGRVTGGTLTATRSLNSPKAADPAGLGAVLTSRATLGAVTVTRAHTVQTGGGNQSIARYYAVEPSQNNDGLSATLTHTYHDAELNGLSESSLELFKSTDGGTSWTEKGADSRTTSPTGGNTVTLKSISSFSRWTLGGSGSPLPVGLAGFEGEMTGHGVRLTWRTVSERGNAGFKVQRRGRAPGATTNRGAVDGLWKTIGRVDGAGSTTQAQSYRFTDEDLPYAADSLSYRLKQIDADGTVTTTDPITIERGGVERLALEKAYPNPARSHVTIRYAVPDQVEGPDVTVRLCDILGRRVQTVVGDAEAGRHEVQLSVTDLASGVYVMRLTAGQQTRTRRLTVVR